MKTAAEAALDYLDGASYGANAGNMVDEMPEFSFDELKEALQQLYKDGKIQRLSIKSYTGKFYYTYFSLYYRTVEGYVARATEPTKSVLSEDQAQRVMSRLEQELEAPKDNTVTEGKPIPFLYAVPDAPEVVREVVKYREARFGIMDVIDRWKLNFRLSRIIEIVGSARNRKLTKGDAALVCRMINEHVGEA